MADDLVIRNIREVRKGDIIYYYGHKKGYVYSGADGGWNVDAQYFEYAVRPVSK